MDEKQSCYIMITGNEKNKDKAYGIILHSNTSVVCLENEKYVISGLVYNLLD